MKRSDPDPPQGSQALENHRLIWVMGPSGAGKDSLLAWLRERLPAGSPVHWARRTITRPPSAREAHEAVDGATFEALERARAFAMAWRAHGLCYGIRHEQLASLHQGRWVVVNGSRAYFAQAQCLFPGLTAVHVTASPELLAQRLAEREREDAGQVRARVARGLALPVPPGCIELRNDGPLEDAAAALLRALREHARWPG